MLSEKSEEDDKPKIFFYKTEAKYPVYLCVYKTVYAPLCIFEIV